MSTPTALMTRLNHTGRRVASRAVESYWCRYIFRLFITIYRCVGVQPAIVDESAALSHQMPFLPRFSLLPRNTDTIILSVSPSVRLFLVYIAYCIETYHLTFFIIRQRYHSIFLSRTVIQNSGGNTPGEGVKYTWGKKSFIFDK